MSDKQNKVYTYKVSKLSLASRIILTIQFYLYWNLKSKFRRNLNVLKMLLTQEVRLYYTYTTKKIIKVTWKNYKRIVKIDAGEYAILLQRSSDGYSDVWMRAERF